jgi:hypothetical protein
LLNDTGFGVREFEGWSVEVAGYEVRVVEVLDVEWEFLR